MAGLEGGWREVWLEEGVAGEGKAGGAWLIPISA